MFKYTYKTYRQKSEPTWWLTYSEARLIVRKKLVMGLSYLHDGTTGNAKVG